MKKTFAKITALLLTLTLVLSLLPAQAMAEGEAEEWSAAPVQEVLHNGGVVTSPVTSAHDESASRKGPALTTVPYFRLDNSRLTSVKDQGYYGTCWAHSALGSSESLLETDGLGNDADLSEWQLAYYAYVSQNGLPAFDITRSGSVFDQGGNDDMAVALLARGSSPVLEGQAVYGGAVPLAGIKPSYTLDNWYIAHNTDEWKILLMQEGALSISYHDTNGFYNETTYSYYLDYTAAPNHAVTLVGWDDNYPAGNFNITPPGNGAWIVKNSWAASWGENGFFYLSYYDKSLNTLASAYELKPLTASESVYTYDDLGWVTSLGYNYSSEPNIAALKSVYTASGNVTLNSVGTFAVGDTTVYSIMVNTMNPATGALEPAWSAPQTGTIAMAGYARIDLTAPVALTAGQQFEVIITYSVPGCNYPVPVEATSSYYSSGARYAPGQSFISHYGLAWEDLGPYQYDACIFAYTTPNGPATSYTVMFDSQGGTAVPPMVAGPGATIAAPPSPSRSGYYFAGWYKEPSCVSKWDFAVDTVTADIALYARWLALSQTVTLSGISLSAGTLSPAFSPARKSYTVYLDENTGGATITPVKSYPGATLWINGKKAASKTVYLANGKSATLTVKVGYGKKSTTIRLTVKRAKCTNNILAALSATGGTLSPAFDPNVTTYTLVLPEGTAKARITAVRASKLASLTNGSRTYTLKNGQKATHTVKVRAQSGAIRTYRIYISREKSTNANLSSLKSSVKGLTPAFHYANMSYSVTLPAGTPSVTLSWKIANTLSKATVDGKRLTSKKITVASGQSVTVYIVVTAQAGNTQTYQVVVSRS